MIQGASVEGCLPTRGNELALMFGSRSVQLYFIAAFYLKLNNFKVTELSFSQSLRKHSQETFK